MSETNDGTKPPAPLPIGEQWNAEYLGHAREMLWRQLNEVHLLLDHVSSLANHSIGDVTVAMPAADGKEPLKLSGTDLALRLARMHFPPTTQYDFELNSAILLSIKDKLAPRISPARGMTIAFTYMFVGDEAQPSSRARRGGADEAAAESARIGISRFAFPWLAGPVANLNRTLKRLRWFILLLIIPLLAFTSWDIYYAGGLLDDHAQFIREYDGFFAANHDRPASCPPIVKGAASDDPRLAKVCDDYRIVSAKIASSYLNIDRFTTIDPRPVPDTETDWSDYLWAKAKRAWTWGKLAIHPVRLTVVLWDDATPAAPASALVSADDIAHRARAARLAGVVAVFKSYVLAMLFGVLGAWVRILRQIEDRVTRFVLGPSDRFMVLSGMFSGVVAGFTVGLFFYGAGSTSQAISVGGVGLSAGALSFLAGYGYDRFYKLLDGLLDRVFDATPVTRPEAAPPRAVTQPAPALPVAQPPVVPPTQ